MRSILSALSDGALTGKWELTDHGLKFLKFLLLVNALRARFQSSFAVEFRSSLLWVVSYRWFIVFTEVYGEPIGLFFKGYPEDGTDRNHETSVSNYQLTLHNNPEERSPNALPA